MYICDELMDKVYKSDITNFLKEKGVRRDNDESILLAVAGFILYIIIAIVIDFWDSKRLQVEGVAKK